MSLVFRDNAAIDLMRQEMASGERQAANRKIAEENLFKSLGAAEQQAETDGFQCGRCKQVCPPKNHMPDLLTLRRGSAVIARLRLAVLMSP